MTVGIELPEAPVARKKSEYPAIKVEPEVHQLARKVAAIENQRLGDLINDILKAGLEERWDRIVSELRPEPKPRKSH